LEEFQGKIGQSNGNLVVLLPDGENNIGIPTGTIKIQISEKIFEADFEGNTLSMLREEGQEKNELNKILKGWFGDDAGLPGTNFEVEFKYNDSEMLQMIPIVDNYNNERLTLWKRYKRNIIPACLGFEIAPNLLTTGVVQSDDFILLFVTLEKKGMPAEFQYKDKFLSPTLFQWQSQNRTRQESAQGQKFREPHKYGKTIHLFIRPKKDENNMTVPFHYCGVPRFIDWKGEQPITVKWELSEAVPEYLCKRLKVPD